MTIAFLLVDDNGVERDIIADLLRRAMPGAQVLETNRSDDGLRMLDERRLVPSMVFTDFAMADRGGLDLLSGLRRVPWLQRTPVTVVSASLSDRETVTAYRLGACAVLTKPARLHELRAVIREFAQPAKLLSAISMETLADAARGRSAA